MHESFNCFCREEGLPRFFLKVTCFMIVIVLSRQFFIDISNYPNIFPNTNLYESYGISDWLVNFQSGIVRRGLAGEIIWLLFKLRPYPVVFVLITLNIICLVGLTILCVYLFKRMGWPLWILLFPMFLYYRYYGLGMGIIDSRRDCLLLLMEFLLFCKYKSYLVGRDKILIVWSLSIIIFMLHEGKFFSVFPFLVVYTLKFYGTWKKCKLLGKLLYIGWPIVMLLVLIVVVHGRHNNECVPEMIWTSWTPLFESYPYGDSLPPLGRSIEGLPASLIEALDNHIQITWFSDFFNGVPIWPFNIYTLMAIYYLFTRMDVMEKQPFPVDHRIQMSNILIIQMIFTLPMLGFIADDWYRSIPDCCVTTTFLCYSFRERQYIPLFIDNLSKYVQMAIGRTKILNYSWTYYIVLISLPLCLYNARPGGMFPFIPIDVKSRLIEMIIG